MKHIRLEKLVTDETLDKLLDVYKEAKKSHDISKILGFKSFVTRMVEAQNERVLCADGEYRRQWTTLDEYIKVIYDTNQWPRNVHSPLDHIIKNIGISPFGYNRKEHLNRIL